MPYLNKSEWVPVSTRINTSSLSFCFQTNSQSGYKWHSMHPLYLPINGRGEYFEGMMPVFAKTETASTNIFSSSPRFRHFLKAFLKAPVTFISYFAVICANSP